ncbi:uncharacterized protein LOC117104485 [Anneissia japonica]|uniref:uncharacterized protein LOC117104485 n=1 Tax=Anneissia japonica TaxID=1529436 RepID=UPI0014259066|nr:uncharacterized protein LOC117104485 [Anneissia japonica]
MERHKCCLQDRCRLCGNKRTVNLHRLKPKWNYARDINLSLSVDVSKDVEGVHPNFICDCCKMKLHRWRNFRNKNKEKGIAITVMDFVAHSDDSCSICESTGGPVINLHKLMNVGKELGFLVQANNDKATFIRIVNDMPVIRLHIYSKCTWNLNVFLSDATNKCAEFAEFLTDEKAVFLLEWLSGISICCGNSEFESLCRKESPSNLAVFCNNSGVAVAKEVVINGESTIRHVNCQLFVSDIGGRCQVCKMHRTTLMSKKSKLASMQTVVNTNSHARNDRMSCGQLRQKLALMSNEKKTLQKRVNSLQDLVTKSFHDNGIRLQETMCESLETIMRDNTKTANEEFKEGTPQRLLWEQQVAANKVAKTHRRWHPAIIRFCLALHLKSTAAYRMVRNSGYLILPHENTARLYTIYRYNVWI